MHPKPTPEMLAWHDYEIGLFFHYDIEVFVPEWRLGQNDPLPPASVWNPVDLDTDQWLRTAVEAGARYALLTAKHFTGFCLWPTKLHDYHVGNASVTTDIVGEFISSCRKHGIAPGLYYSLGGQHLRNTFTDSDGNLDRESMNEVLLAQVEELITTYGPLSEFWFDGGIRRPEKGGPDVPGLINRIAPDLICFGGCPGIRNVLRWSGSEQGVAVPECWSTAHFLTEPERNNVTCDSPGDPDDPIWAPVEVDIPPRDVLSSYAGGWMYHEDDGIRTYDGDHLFARYLTSVGRNANLLIGCLPDRNGLISTDQIAAFAGLGRNVREHLGTPLAQTRDGVDAITMELRFDNPVDLTFAEIQEDITAGQHILGWQLELLWPETWNKMEGRDVWIPVEQGRSIGHKRIIQLNVLRAAAIRVRVAESRDGARLSAFRVYGHRVYD